MSSEINMLPYDEAKKIAADGDANARLELASNQSAPPEILYYLAIDDDVSVRKAVATNAATPMQADFLLSNDTESSIRMDLAAKIGRQLEHIDENSGTELYAKASKVLENLVSDQLPTVRSIISEEIKQLSNVPRGVIVKLARDAETSVAGPILEHSPLLEDKELIGIISDAVREEHITSIAKRNNIGEEVSQSITDSGSVEAVSTLLENKTAQIAPSTMDDITNLASENEPLHRPLANRDDLTDNALKRMAGFVGAAIVEELIDRYPLTPENQKQLRARVQAGIDASNIPVPVETQQRSGKYRILVAEDDPPMQMLISEVIQSFLDVDVTVVGDGEIAMEALVNKRKFDLIISDWMMPKVSGIELLRSVRSRNDDTPFIMLTARKDVDSIVAAQNDGVDAFIAKPLTLEILKDKVRVLLR
jgi:CheY-like chemotaxis protein